MTVPIAGFVLDTERRVLLDASGTVVALRPQAYEVLQLLARSAGGLVTKDELLAAVWPGVAVTEDSLVQAIGDIRRALGPAGHRVLKTIARRGYLLLPQATPTAPSDAWRSPVVRISLAVIAAAACIAVWLPRPASSPDAPPASIAVLPFKGGREHADDEVIALDIASELVSELARSPDLRVVSSQSSFRFSAEAEPLARIGERLGTRYLVDGTARRVGEVLRIGVTLLDSRSGEVVWTVRHEADRTTLAEAQQAIVGRIAGTLQSRVLRSEERRVLAAPPNSFDVFVLTARGKQLMQRYDAEGVRAARAHLRQAVAADAQHAAAWAYLAMTDTIDIGLRLTGERDRGHGEAVLAAARRALALQPDLTIAHVALSQALGLLGQFDASLLAAQECLRRSPNDAGCFYAIGAAQLRLGDAAGAAEHLAQASDRNPFAPAFLPAFHATALWASRRHDEAIRVAQTCLDLAPDFARCRMDRIAALVESGRIDEARREADELRRRSPQIRADHFGTGFSEQASPLRDRRVAAARLAGI